MEGNGPKPTVLIEDWSLTVAKEKDPYTAPEMSGRSLYGRVTGHPHHKEGSYVTTSTVLASFGSTVETHNTIYKLGEMSEGYMKFVKAVERQKHGF